MLKWLTGPEVQHFKENEVRLDGEVIDTCGAFGRVVRFIAEPGKYRMVIDDGTGQLTLNINKRESDARPIVFGKVDVRWTNKRRHVRVSAGAVRTVRREAGVRVAAH